ncbi:uncharacterized protein [Branchiostoma lanceolatum]|uniref:uncharacterized protein n=1 Tax=Branchiostoma lanceolatum TaxID=7740 RepID=UPI003454C43B
MGRFSKEIAELQGRECRLPDGRTVRLRVRRLCLTHWCGISGACGVRPCLYCEVRKECMKLPRDGRTLLIPERDLARMATQYANFMRTGRGKLKYAKYFRNVVAPAMLSITLDQVCIPGLHLSLGIFHKLYVMLENDQKNSLWEFMNECATSFITMPINAAEKRNDST